MKGANRPVLYPLRYGHRRSSVNTTGKEGSVELRQLELFSAVARHLHFTRAADECFITQSALSQQIIRLERELGVQLFERHSRRVKLTLAGLVLLTEGSTVLASMERAIQKTREATATTISPHDKIA